MLRASKMAYPTFSASPRPLPSLRAAPIVQATVRSHWSSVRPIKPQRDLCGMRAAPATANYANDIVHIPATTRILLVGITGVTGRSALQGFLTTADPGRSGHQLVALTRNPSGADARSLPRSIQVVEGNLQDTISLERALQGATAVYCHALSKDAATADAAELTHAKNLAAAARAAGVQLIIYNSSGGRGCGYGITQMEQKHLIEDILAAAVPTVALRASMFMEELWKRYTRPGILKGTFTWSTPTDRPIQLVTARDVGMVAACILDRRGADSACGGSRGDGAGSTDIEVPPGELPSVVTVAAGDPGRPLRLRALELSGDELSPAQMCEVFTRVQGFPVRHNRAPVWPFWFIARDVFRISRFLTERGFDADVAACRAQFPRMLTFEEFLRETRWAEPSRAYEDGIAFSGGEALASPVQPHPQQ